MNRAEKENTIPVFAVLGHPNEGKSSVVSTLTEDDQIKVSQIPGETTVSGSYTVSIDGRDIIRFVDTPGFQMPKQTLAWFRANEDAGPDLLERFIETHRRDPFFADECELLAPVAKGAGIIFVVDGARPVRDDDRAEMEILRLTGRPRIAVINSKSGEKDFTRDWQEEFRKSFNAIRIFNSNTANFTERIKMLESLKSIDQEWEFMLHKVVDAFEREQEKRIRLAGTYIIQAIEKSLSHSVSKNVSDSDDPQKTQKQLQSLYQDQIRGIEKNMFKRIRVLFRHHLYDLHLPQYSVLQYDLFSRRTWELLGLTKQQLAAAGAVLGGTMGVAVDAAAGGITFGIFTAIGGLIGAGSALFGGKKLAAKSKAGLRFGGEKIRLGPVENIQFLYVLMDRALIYYSHIINRPHGKRDMDPQEAKGKKGISTGFTSRQRKLCTDYFKAVTRPSLLKKQGNAIPEFSEFVESILNKMAKE